MRRFFRLPRSRRSIEGEIEDEIRFHLESRVEALRQRGRSAAEAREIAEREYGDLAASRAELAAVDRRQLGGERRREAIASVGQDLRYAWRGLVRRPAFAAVATLTLTLGIGANAVTFGIVDQLLLRPPAHVARAGELRQVYIRERDEDAEEGASAFSHSETTSYAVVRALREQVPSFAEVVGWTRGAFTLGRGAAAQPVDVAMVDGHYFSTLGVRPAAGRFFAPDESRVPAGALVVVVADNFRRRYFGDASDPTGRTLEIDGRTFTVVGVAPPGFTGVDRIAHVDLWVPAGALADLALGAGWHASGGVPRFHAVARLRPGASLDRAAAEATRALRAEARGVAEAEDTLATAVLGSINDALSPDGVSAEARTSLWLTGVSAIVLLIAAANVANLLVTRAVQRRREIAIRIALGVSRARLLRQLFTEAVLLAAIAGAVALLAAAWAGRVVQRVLLPGYAWSDAAVDGRVLAFTSVVMLVACVLAGLAPVVHALRTDVSGALKAGSRDWTGTRSTLRRALLVAQTSLSVVLLVGAGLFVRSLTRVQAVDVGIDLDRVLIAGMDLERAGYDTARQRLLLEAAVERLRHTPGVAGATTVGASAPRRVGYSMRVRAPGRDSSFVPPQGGPYYSVIDAHYLAVMGAELRRGRAFLPAELGAPSRVALVNETAAAFYWPGKDPVGECLFLAGERACTEVVGVVQPIMLFRLVNEPKYAQLFLPPTHPASGSPARTLLVRVAGDGSGAGGAAATAAAAAQVRATLAALAPEVPYVSVRSFADLMAPQLRPWRLGATMFGVFGLVALAIAAIGLYGVLAYWVSQRRYEFGVRMALGARRLDIQRQVAGEAARTVGLGLTIGLALAALAAPRAAALLFHTSPHHPAVYGAVAGLLALAALAAAVVPVFTSTRVSPASALRAE